MANQLGVKIVEEGPRNAVVNLTGVLDTTDVNEVSVISPSMFSNNDRNASRISGFRVDHITFSIGNGLEIQINWNGSVPELIAPIAGRGRIDATGDGGLIPDMTRGGYDGTINLTTTGFSALGPPQNFTVFLRLVKLYQR